MQIEKEKEAYKASESESRQLQKFEFASDINMDNEDFEWHKESDFDDEGEYKNRFGGFKQQFHGESTFDENEYTSALPQSVLDKFGDEADKEVEKIIGLRDDRNNIHVAIDRDMELGSNVIGDKAEEMYSSVWRQKDSNKNRKNKNVFYIYISSIPSFFFHHFCFAFVFFVFFFFFY